MTESTAHLADGPTNRPVEAFAARARRREMIEKAALLFERRGYPATTVEDIAAAVCMPEATIHDYFRSKDDILVSIHQESMDRLLACDDERRRHGLDPEHHLLEFMPDMLEMMDMRRGYARVFFEHHRELPPGAREPEECKRDEHFSCVKAIIQRTVDEGKFRDVDIRLTALALFGMCNWAHQLYQPGGRLRPREAALRFWRRFLQGLERQPDRAAAA